MYFSFTIFDLRSAFTRVEVGGTGRGICYSRSGIYDLHLFQLWKGAGAVGVSVFHDLQSAIWIYISAGRGVWVEVSVIHDLRAFCIYSSGGRGVWVWVSFIHNLQSAIYIFFSGVGVSVIHDLRPVISIYFSGGKGV